METQSKLSESLLQRLSELPDLDAPVVVAIELVTHENQESAITSAGEWTKQQKAVFNARKAPVIEKIVALSGEVLDELWLSDSLTAKIPASSVYTLSQDENISLLDVPQRIVEAP